MKKQGFTLVELLTGMSVMSVVLLGTMTLLVSGMRSFKRTTVDVDNTNQNANSLRKVSETLRQAMNVTISNSGKTISFNLPAMGGVDPVTGEKELFEPLTSDGVARSYSVDFGTGKLTESPSGRVLMKNIASVDPQTGSAQYNQAYTPFQLTSIGSYRAVTVNLITTQTVIDDKRFMRMKTTAVVRNVR
jgi:prepilin-type N-terminal cleavage/methylation domain-containing protein